MNIRLVIFDMAGTTVVDKGNINEAFRSAFLNAGYKVNAADVDKVMGYRKIDAIKIILEKYINQTHHASAHLIDIIHNDFTGKMVQFYEQSAELKPMPFAEEVFEQLQEQGLKTALNTGFTKVITDTILKRLGWTNSPLINAVISSDEVPEGRPHSFMIEKIMRLLNIDDAHKVAKVGDTEVDIEEGRNAGCGLVVAVTTGAYTKDQLKVYSPDYIIDSLQQLPALIQ
ncbi:MAG: HAD family hydrolase [Ginsengibacter sp.]